MEERLRQTVVILRKLTQELGFPYESPEVQAIKERMHTFVQTGESWDGVLSLAPWDRQAHLSMRGNTIELTLKPIRKR